MQSFNCEVLGKCVINWWPCHAFMRLCVFIFHVFFLFLRTFLLFLLNTRLPKKI
jgi:hypothetical protein